MPLLATPMRRRNIDALYSGQQDLFVGNLDGIRRTYNDDDDDDDKSDTDRQSQQVNYYLIWIQKSMTAAQVHPDPRLFRRQLTPITPILADICAFTMIRFYSLSSHTLCMLDLPHKGEHGNGTHNLHRTIPTHLTDSSFVRFILPMPAACNVVNDMHTHLAEESWRTRSEARRSYPTDAVKLFVSQPRLLHQASTAS